MSKEMLKKRLGELEAHFEKVQEELQQSQSDLQSKQANYNMVYGGIAECKYLIAECEKSECEKSECEKPECEKPEHEKVPQVNAKPVKK